MFLTLCQKWGNIEDINIRAWLYSVADRKIKEYFRTKHDIPESYEDKDQNDVLDVSYDVDYIENLYHAVMGIDDARDKVMSCLSDSERLLYTYIYKDKLIYADIAVNLNTSESAVKMKSKRLKHKIIELAKNILQNSQFLLLLFCFFVIYI